MKLYIYDHCPFCIRARMIFGFKNIAIEQIVLLDNDIETPTRMIGRKMVPILQKEDGSYLPESLDIVRYVDGLNEPKFADGIISGEIEHWFKAVSAVVPKLVAPRFVEIDFPEVSTAEAKAAYVERTIKSYGDLTILRNETHTLLTELEPHMAFLDEWLENRGDVINIDDFIIFPILRSLSIVADLPFSTNIQKYMGSIATKTNVDLLFNKAR